MAPLQEGRSTFEIFKHQFDDPLTKTDDLCMSVLEAPKNSRGGINASPAAKRNVFENRQAPISEGSIRALLFPEGLGFDTAGAGPGLELELLALDTDGGAGGDGVGDEHVGADDAVPSDHCAAA